MRRVEFRSREPASVYGHHVYLGKKRIGAIHRDRDGWLVQIKSKPQPGASGRWDVVGVAHDLIRARGMFLIAANARGYLRPEIKGYGYDTR